MKVKQIRLIGYCLTAGLILLTSAVGGCSPKPKLSSISVDPSLPNNLHIGAMQQFTATGTYSDGSTSDISSRVTWVSSDTTVATISVKGIATGIAIGNTDIAASLDDISSQSVTLSVVKLLSIAIRQSSPFNLTVKATQQFTATGTFSNGSTEDVTLTGIWNSSIPAVASVSTIGLATGVAPGSASITVSESGITSPPLTLTVSLPDTSPTISSIAISRSVITALAVGSTQQFTATALYTDGKIVDVTAQATWASSNPSIATVSSTGLATGVSPGKASISAFYSGVNSMAISLTIVSP